MTSSVTSAPLVAVVAIGRNEGARLSACLMSLKDRADLVVYVDSGSTDGSQDLALGTGAVLVSLDMSLPFTAARARNAGFEKVKALLPSVSFVQFLDSDCEIDPDWLSTGAAALLGNPDVAVVCGRRREKFPDATLWNQMIDREWANTKPGDVPSCGGDALMRAAAFDTISGFNPTLIAGEEPELCYRMRHAGWRIVRLDAAMTQHDADLTKFSQFWQRARRTGHTYAEGVHMYGATPERYRMAEIRRSLLWGGLIPLCAVLGGFVISSWFLLVFLVWPAQMLRMRLRGAPWTDAVFLTVGKLAEVQGIVGFWYGRLTGRRRALIEYK